MLLEKVSRRFNAALFEISVSGSRNLYSELHTFYDNVQVELGLIRNATHLTFTLVSKTSKIAPCMPFFLPQPNIKPQVILHLGYEPMTHAAKQKLFFPIHIFTTQLLYLSYTQEESAGWILRLTLVSG